MFCQINEQKKMKKYKFKIAFVIDDIQNISKSTLYLMNECYDRNHEVYYIYPRNFTIRHNEAYGFLYKIRNKELYAKTELELLPLRLLNTIFIRTDISTDIQNITCFLDIIEKEILIVNGIEGIRKANNKLYITSFFDPEKPSIIPETYVSKNKEFLKKIIIESPNKYWVLKPFRGTRGRGVIVLSKDSMKNVNSLLDFYIGSEENEKEPKNYIILQEYLPKAEKGDKRILLMDGEIIGAMKRVPATDDNRSNISVGATPVVCKISASDRMICERIKDQLKLDKLYFVGLDIVGDKLIEINVLSPGGLSIINRLYNIKLEKKVIDFLERMILLKKIPKS